jgi:ribonucleoside-diphosphate reductase alpha chain
MMDDNLLNYFNGDELAADVWKSKYQLKDKESNPLEGTPDDMHWRLAKEFGKKEFEYKEDDRKVDITNLSEFGKKLQGKRINQNENDVIEEVYITSKILNI